MGEDKEFSDLSRELLQTEIKRKETKQIEIEQSLETLSTYLDGLFKIPGVGWKFGLDSVVGLIPNVGDLSTSVVSFYILIAGVRYGVPKITLLRMAFNIGLDYVVGSIPFIGDAFDFFWKSNKKNMDLIRSRGKGQGSGTMGDWIFVIAIIAALLILLIGSILLSLFILGIFFGGLYDLIKWG
ncbi:MAG: DUF4112 domain-containing protein [Pyrinomonadaceae bacterium]|nr:DUF4112 domain-containing protein [Pyrinomonadaceae bacterium]